MKTALKEWLLDFLIVSVGNINERISTITNIISQTPEGFNAELYKTMAHISEAIVPIAIVIAVLFFVLSIANKAMMLQIVSFESILPMLLKFLFAKVLIQNSFKLLEGIFSGVISLLDIVGDVPLEQVMMDPSRISGELDAIGLGGLLGTLCITVPLVVILWVAQWTIEFIIYGRMIELYIYFSVAPLPIATFASEGLHDIAKRYIQNFVAVCLQAFAIMIALVIYKAFLGSILGELAESSIINYLRDTICMTILLGAVIWRSGSWAQRFVGLC